MDLQSQKTAETEGTEGHDEIAGITQKDLIKWYMDVETKRRTFTSDEGAKEEIIVIKKVINKLVRQGNTLAVLSRPERLEEEEEGDFQQRLQDETVLSLHINYAPDA